jgi:hypothetical protein
MNIKISQLPQEPDAQKTDIFPILRNGENYTASVNSVYNLLSGDKLADVYTSYSKNSSIFINDDPLIQSVYSTYNQNSGNYVSLNTPIANNWQNTSTVVNSSSSNWNSAYTSWNQASSILIKSDITSVPQATAIKNIIAVPLAVYENILVKDPYTFYVVV